MEIRMQINHSIIIEISLFTLFKANHYEIANKFIRQF